MTATKSGRFALICRRQLASNLLETSVIAQAGRVVQLARPRWWSERRRCSKVWAVLVNPFEQQLRAGHARFGQQRQQVVVDRIEREAALFQDRTGVDPLV